ncbi:MAG: transcriptional regulator [Candidatus Cloacimonetes bacterium 4572_65]|nr:MAG: transcriptional regulator [Candidatus Cloacimonetes bacterium 4572_65]
METKIAQFVKYRRKLAGYTQKDLSEKSGVGLRFIRELEQGKKTLRLDKVNEVLRMFGHEVGVVKTTFTEEDDDDL